MDVVPPWYPYAHQAKGVVHAVHDNRRRYACNRGDSKTRPYPDLRDLRDISTITCSKCRAQIGATGTQLEMHRMGRRSTKPAGADGLIAQRAAADRRSEATGNVLAWIVGAAGIAVATVWIVIALGGSDKDCRHFDTQRAAQSYFESRPGDPDNLDGDNDGIACEWLP